MHGQDGKEGMLRPSKEFDAGVQVEDAFRKHTSSRPNSPYAFPPRSIAIKQNMVTVSAVPIQRHRNTLEGCETHKAKSVPDPKLVKAFSQRSTATCPYAVRTSCPPGIRNSHEHIGDAFRIVSGTSGCVSSTVGPVRSALTDLPGCIQQPIEEGRAWLPAQSAKIDDEDDVTHQDAELAVHGKEEEEEDEERVEQQKRQKWKQQSAHTTIQALGLNASDAGVSCTRIQNAHCGDIAIIANIESDTNSEHTADSSPTAAAISTDGSRSFCKRHSSANRLRSLRCTNAQEDLQIASGGERCTPVAVAPSLNSSTSTIWQQTEPRKQTRDFAVQTEPHQAPLLSEQAEAALDSLREQLRVSKEVARGAAAEVVELQGKLRARDAADAASLRARVAQLEREMGILAQCASASMSEHMEQTRRQHRVVREEAAAARALVQQAIAHNARRASLPASRPATRQSASIPLLPGPSDTNRHKPVPLASSVHGGGSQLAKGHLWDMHAELRSRELALQRTQRSTESARSEGAMCDQRVLLVEKQLASASTSPHDEMRERPSPVAQSLKSRNFGDRDAGLTVVVPTDKLGVKPDPSQKARNSHPDLSGQVKTLRGALQDAHKRLSIVASTARCFSLDPSYSSGSRILTKGNRPDQYKANLSSALPKCS